MSTKITLSTWHRLYPEINGEEVEHFLQILMQGQKSEGLEWLRSFEKSDKKIKDLYESLISYLRNILLSKNGVLDFKSELIISPSQTVDLLQKLLAAHELTKDSPIEVLPLELLVSEWEGEGNSNKSNKSDLVTQLPSNPVTSVTSESSQDTNETTNDGQIVHSDNLEMTSEVVVSVWPQVLTATKEHNHTLVAVLRSARPMGLDQAFLIIEVDYPFHKQKLEEPKNRDIVEKVVSDIMGKEIKIKFVLGDKNSNKVVAR